MASPRPTTSAVLAEHAPDLQLYAVLADRDTVADELADLRDLVEAPVSGWSSTTSRSGDGTARHDPHKLASAYGPDSGRG